MFKRSKSASKPNPAGLQQGTELHIKLVDNQFVIENVSAMFAEKLGHEAAPSATALPGKYSYYIPEELDPETTKFYEETLDRILELQSVIIAELKKSNQNESALAAKMVLPVAINSHVKISVETASLEQLIINLLSDELPEAWKTGQKLLQEARKISSFADNTDSPGKVGSLIANRAATQKTIRRLSNQFLPDNHAPATEDVRLVSYWPRNELDLIPDMLYKHSNLSLVDIQKEVLGWPIERKEKAFKAYLGSTAGHQPGQTLEKAQYNWDLVTDYATYYYLATNLQPTNIQRQQLTPRYGYDIPKQIDEAGLTDKFEECFDLSLELYSKLQAAGYALEAQYAVLLGHKTRWNMTVNGKSLFELQASNQTNSAYEYLLQQMRTQLAEVHPLCAESIKTGR